MGGDESRGARVKTAAFIIVAMIAHDLILIAAFVVGARCVLATLEEHGREAK